MSKKVALIILLVMPLCFQNCIDLDEVYPEEEALKVKEQFLTTTHSIVSIKKLYPSSVLSDEDILTSLEIDLQTSEVFLQYQWSQSKVCTLPSTIVDSLYDKLVGVSICEPLPLPEGYFTCLALPTVDIILTEQSGLQHELAELRCHRGAWLCNNLDKAFREDIQEIKNDISIFSCEEI